MLGTTPRTLRQWDATRELVQARKTKGGTRYYELRTYSQSATKTRPPLGVGRALLPPSGSVGMPCLTHERNVE